MTISRRLRFEILRRDSHTCRYCGTSAPTVPITVDHVVPVALGGKDDPSNLVAACRDCNSGKSATSPDAPLVADVAQDAIRWAAAMKRASEDMLADLARDKRIRERFREQWESWSFGPDHARITLPGGWENSVDQFISAGLPLPVLLDCVDKAMSNNKVGVAQTFRYMCGICWNLIKQLQESACGVAASGTGSAGEAAQPDIPARVLTYEVWGYLPWNITPEALSSWARRFREDAASDDEYEDECDGRQHVTGWPDQECAFVQAMRDVITEYSRLHRLCDLMLKEIPADIRDEALEEGREVYEVQDPENGSEDNIRGFALLTAVQRMAKTVQEVVQNPETGEECPF